MAITEDATSHKKHKDRATGRSDGSQSLPEKLGFLSAPEARSIPQTGIFQFAQLDKNVLEPSPINPDWILEGNPEAMCKELSSLSDHRGNTCHWSCTSGRFDWHYGWDEAVLFLEGLAEITDENGNVYVGQPGVSLFFSLPEHLRCGTFRTTSAR
ncbi:cupin domain-containing protein [Roseibium salinum]|nr:cupin domain-containing protein [Roseibium salinum]